MSQRDLRKTLNEVIKVVGIKSKTISEKTGINQAILSRFKNGQFDLCPRDLQILNDYLSDFSAHFQL